LLDLGQNANKLFNQADSATKNQILKIVAANIELYDKRVSFTLSDPYNAFSLLNRNYEDDSKNDLWCDKLSNQLTSRAIELEQNVSFQELVDSLSLNGELLSV
jgi:hypothetical protein